MKARGKSLDDMVGEMDNDEIATAFMQFADVLNADESEEPILAPGPRAAMFQWMAEIRAEAELKAFGIKPRSKALLYGPPGTGKTTLAWHLAARLGIPLVRIRTESVVEKWVGGTGMNMGALWSLIDRHASEAVFFFDEIDSLAGKREGGQSSDKERNSYLNIMLQRFERSGAVIIGATNRHEEIDPAMWRRFDMQISVDLPEADERFAIIKRYAEPLNPPEDAIEFLVDLTAGASPALLRSLLEGMKRALVVWPRIRRDHTDAKAILSTILASLTPPPEIKLPPLWNVDFSPRSPATALERLAWPWERAA
jgi:SpoVK/Ycf46/Vps4 family AAA+-type ATPase